MVSSSRRHARNAKIFNPAALIIAPSTPSYEKRDQRVIEHDNEISGFSDSTPYWPIV